MLRFSQKLKMDICGVLDISFLLGLELYGVFFKMDLIENALSTKMDYNLDMQMEISELKI